eukprot:COSAG02_NODE_3519_length_6620_cov_7.023923_7_plen_58_part_00
MAWLCAGVQTVLDLVRVRRRTLSEVAFKVTWRTLGEGPPIVHLILGGVVLGGVCLLA